MRSDLVVILEEAAGSCTDASVAVPGARHLCRALDLPASPSVIVLVAPKFDSVFAVEAIERVRRLALCHSTILVTNFDPANVIRVCQGWSGEIVWTSEVSASLCERVEAFMKRDLRRQVYDLLASVAIGNRLGPQACRHFLDILDVAFLGPRPVTCHRALAMAAAVGERTVRQCWRDVGFPGRSEALVDWSLLAHFTQLRLLGVSVSRSATSIGSDPWRIQRAAERRLGVAAGRTSDQHLLGAVTLLLR